MVGCIVVALSLARIKRVRAAKKKKRQQKKPIPTLTARSYSISDATRWAMVRWLESQPSSTLSFALPILAAESTPLLQWPVVAEWYRDFFSKAVKKQLYVWDIVVRREPLSDYSYQQSHNGDVAKYPVYVAVVKLDRSHSATDETSASTDSDMPIATLVSNGAELVRASFIFANEQAVQIRPSPGTECVMWFSTVPYFFQNADLRQSRKTNGVVLNSTSYI